MNVEHDTVAYGTVFTLLAMEPCRVLLCRDDLGSVQSSVYPNLDMILKSVNQRHDPTTITTHEQAFLGRLEARS